MLHWCLLYADRLFAPAAVIAALVANYLWPNAMDTRTELTMEAPSRKPLDPELAAWAAIIAEEGARAAGRGRLKQD